MSVIDTLITDRTRADVEIVESLAARGWARMTEAQRTQWLSDLKGAYNASDLNRVGEAVAYLVERLAEVGVSVDAVPKQDWAAEDIPYASQMERYLKNIISIRGSLGAVRSVPPAPDSMGNLTYEGANDIEQILVDIDHLLTLSRQTYVYSGQVMSGMIWRDFT